MKIRLLAVCVLFLAHALTMRADDPKAAAAPPAPDSLAAQLPALVGKIKAKLSAGARNETDLASELKEFDALVAAHSGEKTDDVAQVVMLEAALYLQVFQNFEKATALLTRVTTDFPETASAASAKQILVKLDEQKETLKAQAALKPGVTFPDFSEKDLTGAPLSISQYKNKVVLVDFWATWCGPCVAELPNVLAAYQKYHSKGFEIVGVSLDQSESALKEFIKAKGMTWAQYFDGQGWDSKLGKQYSITSIPSTFLLDREGKIVATNLRGPDLEAELARLLGP